MADKPLTPREAMAARLSHRESNWRAMDEFCTRHLMIALRLKLSVTEIIRDKARTSGRYHPIMADLRDSLSNLPVFFAVDHRKELQREGSLGNLFPVNKFKKLNFVTRFWEIREELAIERGGKPLALLIKWPRLAEPMVLHTCAYPRQAAGVRITYAFDETVMTLEPLSQFLGCCLAEYAPSVNDSDEGADFIESFSVDDEDETLPSQKTSSLPNLDSLDDEADWDITDDMELDIELDD